MDIQSFESLSPEEQVKVFHHSPLKDRGDLILHSHKPLELARSLSCEELYLVIREMDTEERSEVLSLATTEQLVFISDLDCWKKDRLETQSFVQWLETLERAGDDKLLEWILEMDHETVVTGLQKIMQIAKPDREYASDELLGDMPYFTLDQFYYFYVKEESLETVKRAMEILFENHKGRYFAIVESILQEVENELEEEAFQRREARLADRGFPDPVTAYKIYTPISQEEFDSFPKKDAFFSRLGRNDVRTASPTPQFPVLYKTGELFLDQVFKLIQESDLNLHRSILEEVVWLSNKVLIGDGFDFTSEDRVKRGVIRTRSILSLGLELLSGGDLKKAVSIATEKWLETVFRWGFAEILKLRRDLEKLISSYWGNDKKMFLSLLDHPYDSLMKGVLQKIPQMHEGNEKSELKFRDFCHPQDLEKIRLSIHQIQLIHKFLKENMPNVFERIIQEVIRGEKEITLFSIVLTVMGNFTVDAKMEWKPLTGKEAVKFLSSVFQGESGRRGVDFSVKEAFLKHFLKGESFPELNTFFSLAFQVAEEELAQLDFKKQLNPKYVSLLWLKE